MCLFIYLLPLIEKDQKVPPSIYFYMDCESITEIVNSKFFFFLLMYSLLFVEKNSELTVKKNYGDLYKGIPIEWST